MDHSVTTAAVPRDWFTGFVAGLFDGVTKRSVDGRFEGRDFVFTATKWSRSGVAAGVLDAGDGMVVDIELLTVPAPERLRLSGADAAVSWRGSVDLAAWTAECVVRHRLFTAEVNGLVADVDAPRWGVVVRMEIAPKSWGRVLWPLARVFAYDRLRRRFQHEIDELAAAWDAAAADLLPRHPSDAAESVLSRA